MNGERDWAAQRIEVSQWNCQLLTSPTRQICFYSKTNYMIPTTDTATCLLAGTLSSR